jgi:predicted outer membrane protein
MVNFRFSALALLSLGLLVVAASGQQRQGNRTRQMQPTRPAATQYGQYRQQTQQRTTDRTYSATTDEYGRPRAVNADRKIAVLMANCNKAEVKLARYALDRAESSEVRSFADSLQQDHDITLRQLRRFAPEIGGSDSSDSNRGYQPEQRRSGERTTRAWDDATVAQQISERLVRKARDELSEKEGWEFDHSFVGQQLVAHQQDIARLEVYRQYASPELRQVIDESIQIAEGHEQEARDLASDLRRSQDRDEYAGSDRRERYSRARYSRDESDDEEGRVERASYEERRRDNRDDDQRRYRDRDRDDAQNDDSDDEDEEMEDDDRNREGLDRDSRDRDDDEDADDDEDDDDDNRAGRRDEREEQYFRDRDR